MSSTVWIVNCWPIRAVGELESVGPFPGREKAREWAVAAESRRPGWECRVSTLREPRRLK